MIENTGTHIVAVNVTPVRVKPDPDSEQDTQCTMWQYVNVKDESGAWSLVSIPFDNTQGWVRSSSLISSDEVDNERLSSADFAVISSLFAEIRYGPSVSSRIATKLTIGIQIPVKKKRGAWTNFILPDNTSCWIKNADIEPIDMSGVMKDVTTSDAIIYTAERFVGVPYLWGGVTPFGLDCSGFVQLVYNLNGIRLPRNANQQEACEQCKSINLYNIAQGDLLFFAGDSGTIGHVGIALDSDNFIHSCGPRGVCISKLNSPPYSDMLFSAKRIVYIDV